MNYFDPDSSDRKKFVMFEEQQQQSVVYTSVKTTIQILSIFFVLRVCMIGTGFAFFHIPWFDDMCWHVSVYLQEYLKQMQ